jgi:hypothetical protein
MPGSLASLANRRYDRYRAIERVELLMQTTPF